jgi:hypothetical protein
VAAPGLSGRSRVLVVQRLFGAALRGNRVLDGPFAATIVAAWKAAVTSNRPIDQEAFLAGLEYAERLTSEEVGVKMPGPDTVLTYCKGLLARVATSPLMS